MEARETELEVSFQEEEKQRQDAYEFDIEMTHHTEEDRKTLRQEAEAHVKALKILEDEFFGLKAMLNDSLQWTIQVVFGVHDRVVEYTNRFYPAVEIPIRELNPFLAAFEGVQDDGLGISVPSASAWPLFLFIFYVVMSLSL